MAGSLAAAEMQEGWGWWVVGTLDFMVGGFPGMMQEGERKNDWLSFSLYLDRYNKSL